MAGPVDNGSARQSMVNRRTRGLAGRVVASCLALSAFSIATLAGLAGGNAASTILSRAIIAMLLCYPLGLIVGMVCQQVIERHILMNEQANPVPELTPEEQELARASEATDGEEPIVV